MVGTYGASTKQDELETEYMNDKLRPKDAGYVVVADTWDALIGGLLS